MDKETRELLAKLFTSQLEQLAKEKDIDCGLEPDRIDYLSILGGSDQITREDVERYIGETETDSKKVEEGEEYFGEIEKILKDFKSQGSIFERADGLLQGIQRNFEDGNLQGTISQGVEGSGLIEETAELYDKVRKAYIIYAFRQLIGDVRDCGIEIGEDEQLALTAAEHLHKGEKEELDEILKQIVGKAEYLTSEQAKKMKELISSVEEFINQTRDLGANIKEAREHYEKAEEAFNTKAFKKMNYFATKARKAAEDARSDRIKGISDSLIFVRSILDDAREIGADVTDAENIYSKAHTAFKEEDYVQSKALIKEAEQLALQLQDAQIQKALSLRKRRVSDEASTGKVVEVEPETPPAQQRRFMRAYPPPPPYSQPYQRPAMRPSTRPPAQGMRKTRCPNCGQSFPTRAGDGPKKVECPFCGMRGLMP
ncbi:MAG: hypothetical protein JSW00_18365 [Thermoplasmata archaeon]|nr:MAG: hypothetical protein JSW00_18365 [Thermoplasmata archaeon]